VNNACKLYRYFCSCATSTNDFANLQEQDRFVYLLNATEPTESSLKKYLAKGEVEEVHKKFLTASRNPWHTLENRPPSPIWVSVFNRNGLRFIRNEAKISNLTTFHCIYLNMFSEPKVDLLFAYLLTDISKDIFNDNRREYGNGLQKFEPNDINKALMVDLDIISKKDEEGILKLYQEYRKTALEKKPKESLLSDINSKFVDIFKV